MPPGDVAIPAAAGGQKRANLGDALDVGGLLAFGTLDDVKLDILSFAQRAVALSDDRRMVNKYVLSLFARDEARARAVAGRQRRAARR